MPGPLYTSLKESFSVHIKQEAEEIIQEASTGPRRRRYSPFKVTESDSDRFQDLMSSLLLLRSHDIHMTNKNLINFLDDIMPSNLIQKLEEESGEGITK